MNVKRWTNRLALAAVAGGWWLGMPARAVELPAPPAPPPPAADEAAAPAEAPAPDAPQPEAVPAPEAEAPAAEAPPAGDAAQPEAIPQAKPGAEAFLGIGGAEVPDLLAAHLGLQEGEGLVVRTLDPNGPAAGAGIEENDLLLKVDGKAVGSQRELREAVVARAPGDEVQVELIHRGKPATKAVKLGERPDFGLAGGAIPLEGLAEEQAKRVREAIEQNMRALEGLKGGDGEALPDALKQLEKRMQFMFRGLGDGDEGGIQFQNSASVRMADDEGSVELQSKDGSKQIRVRDNQGEIQWEGPWDTEQDKAAAPDDIRKRIDRLNIGMIEDNEGGGLRLRILPQGLGDKE